MFFFGKHTQLCQPAQGSAPSTRCHRKWRQNGVKTASKWRKEAEMAFLSKKTNKTDIEKKYGGDAGLLCLLDSLMISANYRTSSQVAQKWRN